MKHDFMWRTHRDLPERGKIGIFNRSYHEEVLIARVHPENLAGRARYPREESVATTFIARSWISKVTLTRNGRASSSSSCICQGRTAQAIFGAPSNSTGKELEFRSRHRGAKILEGVHGAPTRKCLSATSTTMLLGTCTGRRQTECPADSVRIVRDSIEGLRLNYPKTTTRGAAELARLRKH